MGFGSNQNIDPNTYLNLARLQGYVSNPNIVTPYGTQTTQWGQFDQAGYDAAQKKYEEDLAAYNANPPTTFGGKGAVAAPPPQAPKKEDFVTNKDQATITQTLTPTAQALLNRQQASQYDISQAGLAAAENVAKSMSTPFKYTGPDIQTSFNYGQAGAGPAAGQYGLAGAGPSAGQYGTASGGPQAGAFGLFQGGVQAPDIQKQIDTSGVRNVAYGPEAGPQLQTNVASPTLQRSLDVSGLAAMPVNAGTTAQQAIMSRLQPQLDRERAQLQTQLTNQGLAPGGEAYNTAMQQQAQRENDLLTQAALQGINLDMSARQQGLDEQQTLGSFANQAGLSQLGADIQGAGFGNQALQQQFQNQQDITAAQNAAQAQQFGQRAQMGEFGNTAQLAAFNAALQNQQARNAAIAANFAQAQAAGQMGNQAIGQNFAQGQAAQNLANQAYAQNFGQGQAAQQMANQAAGQNYQQNLGAAGFQNQAINQLLNQQLGLYNQPLQTASNLMQASAFQNPNFSTGFQSPNYGNVGTQLQNDVNAANAQRNQNIGGMMQAGGNIIAASLSDRRLKTNIVKVGDDPRGFGIYEYDIFGRRERGVMAQEVEKIIPDAVMEHPSGFKMVNYGAL